MAMIKCPECGKDISNLAVSCPQCGCPASAFPKMPSEPPPPPPPPITAPPPEQFDTNNKLTEAGRVSMGILAAEEEQRKEHMQSKGLPDMSADELKAKEEWARQVTGGDIEKPDAIPYDDAPRPMKRGRGKWIVLGLITLIVLTWGVYNEIENGRATARSSSDVSNQIVASISQPEPVTVNELIAIIRERVALSESQYDIKYDEDKSILRIYRKISVDLDDIYALHRASSAQEELLTNIKNQTVNIIQEHEFSIYVLCYTQDQNGRPELTVPYELEIGMTEDEVLSLTGIGMPADINTTTTEYGVSEQWVYPSSRDVLYGWHGYLYFEDGILDSIQQ